MNLAKIKRLYSQNLRKNGKTPKAFGWKNTEEQFLRFDILIKNFSINNYTTINELGCGYGAFLEYSEINKLDFAIFNGYDIVAELKKYIISNKKYKTNFFLSNKLLSTADFSFASGIFNVKFSEDESKWQNYVLGTINNMFENSNKGLAFNMLTTKVDYTNRELFYADPNFFVDYCKNKFKSKVFLIEDYGLYEWTINIIKDA